MEVNQVGKMRAALSLWPLANFSSNLHLLQKPYCTLTTKAVILTLCVVIVNDLTIQFSAQLLSTYWLPKPSCCWGVVGIYLKTSQWFSLLFFFLIIFTGDKWIDLSWNKLFPIPHKANTFHWEPATKIFTFIFTCAFHLSMYCLTSNS